jgi:hypothetical protein
VNPSNDDDARLARAMDGEAENIPANRLAVDLADEREGDDEQAVVHALMPVVSASFIERELPSPAAGQTLRVYWVSWRKAIGMRPQMSRARKPTGPIVSSRSRPAP